MERHRTRQRHLRRPFGGGSLYPHAQDAPVAVALAYGEAHHCGELELSGSGELGEADPGRTVQSTSRSDIGRRHITCRENHLACRWVYAEDKRYHAQDPFNRQGRRYRPVGLPHQWRDYGRGASRSRSQESTGWPRASNHGGEVNHLAARRKSYRRRRLQFRKTRSNRDRQRSASPWRMPYPGNLPSTC